MQPLLLHLLQKFLLQVERNHRGLAVIPSLRWVVVDASDASHIHAGDDPDVISVGAEALFEIPGVVHLIEQVVAIARLAGLGRGRW